MSHTVASFLREKYTNMAMWLESEGFPRYRNPNGRILPDLPDIALTAFAQTLHDDYADAIEKRDFSIINNREIPPEIKSAVEFVKETPSLHDKFWRYLKLFSDTVS